MRLLQVSTVVVCALVVCTSRTIAQFVPDNGGGTADMPLHHAYTAETQMQIVDGMGVGSPINMDAILTAPGATFEQAGGGLGGTQSAASGLGWQWQMQGTGIHAAYSRNLFMPLGGNVASFPSPVQANSGIEVNAAPRTAFAPVQSFDTEMFRMFGQRVNPGAADPDFDLLRIVAGTDFGLPSPGHTTLTQAGPNWQIDSFFDITYRIDFVGNNTGPFAGRSGSTTGTVRISIPEPGCAALAGLTSLALLRRRRR